MYPSVALQTVATTIEEINPTFLGAIAEFPNLCGALYGHDTSTFDVFVPLTKINTQHWDELPVYAKACIISAHIIPHPTASDPCGPLESLCPPHHVYYTHDRRGFCVSTNANTRDKVLIPYIKCRNGNVHVIQNLFLPGCLQDIEPLESYERDL